jgi:DNA-binding CsgD family transcriptional regulator
MLTKKQSQVLQAVINHGDRIELILEDLEITYTTYRTHLTMIYNKMGVNNKIQAIIMGLRLGLVTLGETNDSIEDEPPSKPEPAMPPHDRRKILQLNCERCGGVGKHRNRACIECLGDGYIWRRAN